MTNSTGVYVQRRKSGQQRTGCVRCPGQSGGAVLSGTLPARGAMRETHRPVAPGGRLSRSAHANFTFMSRLSQKTQRMQPDLALLSSDLGKQQISGVRSATTQHCPATPQGGKSGVVGGQQLGLVTAPGKQSPPHPHPQQQWGQRAGQEASPL